MASVRKQIDPYYELKIQVLENTSFEVIKPIRDTTVSWGWKKYKKTILHPEYYSGGLMLEVKKRFKAATEYLSQNQNSITKIAKYHKVSLLLLKKFGNDLIKGKTLREVINNQFYFTCKFGLDIARAELRFLYDEKERLPKVSDEGLRGITGAVDRGVWQKHGIYTWNDLLEAIFGEVNLKHNVYTGSEGLVFAQMKLREFWNKKGQLPKVKDKDMNKIRSAISKGNWYEFGIKTWNDLLKHTFGEVNNKTNFFKGKDSLNKVQTILRISKNQNGRLPRAMDKEMRSIRSAIDRGYWYEAGIFTWNNLLERTFGFVTLKQKYYTGKKGLENAQKKLLKFKQRTGRLPRNNDLGMTSVAGAIRRGNFRQYGINTWNILLKQTFGEVNLEQNKFTGEKGLENVKKNLREFQKRNDRLPKASDAIGRIIVSAISRGTWQNQGIKTWNDLLKQTFGKINLEQGVYSGEKGLKKAQTKMIKFKEQNGRLPKSTDKGMVSIICTVSRGYWRLYGFTTWNELLFHTFGEVNRKSRRR